MSLSKPDLTTSGNLVIFPGRALVRVEFNEETGKWDVVTRTCGDLKPRVQGSYPSGWEAMDSAKRGAHAFGLRLIEPKRRPPFFWGGAA